MPTRAARRTAEAFLPVGTLAEEDPEVHRLIRLEDERQRRRIILIASESLCPRAVREALASRFGNLYAEGYPSWRMTDPSNTRPLDYVRHLAYHRRYSDGRYYKGCDYVNFVETLAQKRLQALFATPTVPATELFANVQPLSGAAANNAVYEALCEPGDTVLGMKLTHGGHLTHGSPYNRSGKRYRVISYGVDPKTGRLDYEEVLRLAREHRPRLIIGGASAYPFAIDWQRLREAADAVGAYLLADIAHPAGLVTAGLFPSPVGIADVISFTTHKTLCGPRGAALLTHRPDLARRLDAAVFPGEQGGPHIHSIAAKAVAFGLAARPAFRALMARVRENAEHLAQALLARGIPLVGGGTESHLLLIDLDRLPTPTGHPLRGEVATRILELTGLVLNKNTKPGDTSAAHPGGVRVGTVWVSQLGYGPAEMEELAELIAEVLKNIHPFPVREARTTAGHGKIPLAVLEDVRERVAALAARFPVPDDPADPPSGYPHYEPPLRSVAPLPNPRPLRRSDFAPVPGASVLEVWGERCHAGLESAAAARLLPLRPGEATVTCFLDREGRVVDDASVWRLPDRGPGERAFWLVSTSGRGTRLRRWLRALSDGYVLFDEEDVYRKVEGPLLVVDRADPEDTTEPDRPGLLQVWLLGGPDGEAVWRRAAGAPPPPAGEWAEASLGGNTVFIHTLPTPGSAPPLYELLTPSEAGATLAEALRRAGAEPGGPEAVAALREAAGLPTYRDGAPAAAAAAERRPDLVDATKPFCVGHAALPQAAPRPLATPAQPELPLRRTPLYEEHRRLGARMVPFAGWEMPLHYRTTTAEEHAAVRQTAALFDVAHMGVLEVRGPEAQPFLDLVTTNDVAWLRDGQCHYSYLTAPDGSVLDDILVYRLAWDRYMLVVNAVNAEKDLAWLEAVRDGAALDAERPWKHFRGEVTVRDLRAPESGADRRVDLALQGPRHLEVLEAAGAEPALLAALRRKKRFEFATGHVGDIPVLVSRTGYTGSPGVELYVHPDQAPALWRALVAAGEGLGLKPAGLGARDSTRTEAGLPLWGHELAGPEKISPLEAGYEAFVKFHKPFFCGRRALLEHARTRRREVVRLGLPVRGVRVARPGYPVLNSRGTVVGRVTSGVVVGETHVALAIVERRFAAPGTELFVLPVPSRPPAPKPLPELGPGDGWVLPIPASVLRRFL